MAFSEAGGFPGPFQHHHQVMHPGLGVVAAMVGRLEPDRNPPFKGSNL